MHVAVVHSFYRSASPSGENTVVLDQVRELRSAGYEVTLISRSSDDLSLTKKDKVKLGVRVIAGSDAALSGQLGRLSPDVIHVHNVFPNFGSGWIREFSARTVFTAHNYRSVCANGLFFRSGSECFQCLERPVIPAILHSCYRDSPIATLPVALGAAPLGALRRLGREAAVVIALNDSAQTVLERAFGRTVQVVPNFVDAARSDTSVERRGWLFAGRLSSEKGIRDLLLDWPECESLDIVGSGPDESDIKAIARRTKNVRALGPLGRDELLNLLPSYEGIVVPSNCSEGLPTIILEALAAGTPSLVSHRVLAGPQLRDSGVSSIIEPIEDGLQRSMEVIRDRAESVTGDCLSVFERNYSSRVWLARIDAIYESLAGR